MELQVLHIWHRHGDDYWVFRARDDARGRLSQWAKEWWSKEGLSGDPAVLSDNEIIEQYFNALEGREGYRLAEVELEEP